jgi:sortase A
MTTLFVARTVPAVPQGMARGSRGRPPRLPKVPERAPRPPRPKPVLTQRELMARSIFLVISAMLLALVLNVTILSQVQHLVAQQQLINDYREQLAAGTAPVSEGDFDSHLLADGAALGVLSIPSLGVNEVIVEGTSSTVLKVGPGHRRDTVLPGQAGVSVVMGRAAAFGGPFGRIQELAPGDTFHVRTGQGDQVFSVVGVRYAGDPLPSPPTAKQSRLVLETARGPSFIPSGVAYVDTELVGVAKTAGVRQTTYGALPPGSLAMATDTATVWALVFALQFLVLVEFGAVWAYRHVGTQKTWIVFAPLTVLAGLYVANQVTILLPNLL